ncbi:hypothetical protein SCHPADRAFT_907705 [Schizopora paradoxa]|uniref:DUF6533 domain-containing protein n=1 Tax=Schizopora paradoxa TaxID=27342 RepID=A0A0H2RCC8_9AGAM|nr:hypothetical protein SCHPADRAFT_907705 [Schizopora paradoxa]
MTSLSSTTTGLNNSSVGSVLALDALEFDASAVIATRYLNGVGLVLFLYDFCLTFEGEIRFVWPAKSSFARTAFLLNKYVVIIMLIATAYVMNDLTGPPLSDAICRGFFSFTPIIGLFSIALANVLVSLRVIDLWERATRIKLIMAAGILISFMMSTVFMAVALRRIIPFVFYNPDFRMCFPTTKPFELPFAWASSMFYEVLVLTCVCWNALDRPRSNNSQLTLSLHEDGLTFFAALTALRTFNLVLSIVAPPSLILVGSFFIWALTTLVLNRAILNILEASHRDRIRTRPRRSGKQTPSEADDDLEDFC